MTRAVWLALLPLQLLAALGLRRSLILICLFVLAVTAYGVAEDLGLLDPPAAAKPARPARQAPPSVAARADIPSGYLRLYQQAARRCPGLSWSVLAAIGKVESDHGRSRLPGVRSGWNTAGAAGPMQFGIGVGRAGNAWARYGADFDRDGRRSAYDPGDAIPAAARYLCDHGAPRRLDRALYAYNHSWSYMAKVKAIAARYRTRGGGADERNQVGSPAVPVVRQPDRHCSVGGGPRRPDQAATPRPTSSSGCARPAPSRPPTPITAGTPEKADRGERPPGPWTPACSGRVAAPRPTPTRCPACPYPGAGWAGANPDPTPRTDAPPPPTTSQGR